MIIFFYGLCVKSAVLIDSHILVIITILVCILFQGRKEVQFEVLVCLIVYVD